MKKGIKDFVIGGESISLGERKIVDLEVATLFDFTNLKIRVEVIRGKEPGPTLFISGAIHGDEVNGVEIVKRLSKKNIYRNIKGTLILVPIVNVFGFNHKTRYLPDRRDLNRCFPGKKNGSLTSRVAYIFMKEIVKKCSHGIDLHTGAIHRTNYPHIRACLDDKQTHQLAVEFGSPLILNSSLRDGSLREAARKNKVTTLLFEGGEALRHDEKSIKVGVEGCLNVMRKIGMLSQVKKVRKTKKDKVYVAEATSWVRASICGSFHIVKKVGDLVNEGDLLAVISDPFGKNEQRVVANHSGIIIGMLTIPLVNKGDAMFHIADFPNLIDVKTTIDEKVI